MSGGRSDPDRADALRKREIPNRNIAETMLLSALPERIERFLDGLPTSLARTLYVYVYWANSGGP
jgi:hypothetical protein